MTPFRTVLCWSILALLSILTVSQLDVSFIPQSQRQTFTVTFDYPNHPPRVVEQEVTSILENELSQLNELKRIYSKSRYGAGEIQLEFPIGTDLTFREMELNMILRQLRPKLPAEFKPPRVTRRSSEDKVQSPLLIYEFTYTGNDLKANAWLNDFLIPRLGTLPQIRNIETTGNLSYSWKILFDPNKLSLLGLTRNSVIQSLRSAFNRSELGLVESAQEVRPLFLHTKLNDIEDLENLVLRDAILLSDVADIEMIPDRIRSYQRINGQKAIFINCFVHEGVNRIQAAGEFKSYLRQLKNDVPGNYQLALNYDDTKYLKQELDKTWTRAILSVLVIMLFIFISSFSWRYLLILLSSILVSLAVTLNAAWVFGLSFHLYTLAGLTIAIGILVDNTIVLVDNLHKRGNLSVIPAQFASALTTVIALLVIWILPMEYRQNLDDFGLIICLALAASLLVAIGFSPAVSSLVGFSTASNKKAFTKKSSLILQRLSLKRSLQLGVRFRKPTILLFVIGFGLPIFLLPNKWEGQGWYNKTIGSDFYQENLKDPTNKWLGGSLRLFYQEVYEKSSYRSPEKTRLYVNASLPYGHTLDQMNEIVREVEKYLLAFPEIDKFIARVYSGRYSNVIIEFSDQAEKSGFPYQLKNRLIQRSLDWGGVTWNVYGVGKGFSNANYESLPGFQVTLKGYQYEKLEGIATALAEELLKHKRIQEVNTNGQLDWSEETLLLYHFKPDPTHFNTMGYQSSVQFLKNNSPQLQPELYLTYQDKNFPVYLESIYANDISIFTSLYTGNDQVPLNNFGQLQQQKSLSALHKEDRQYIRNVRFDYYGSYRFGSKYLNEVIEKMEGNLPPGFSMERKEWSWGKEREKRQYELILLLMAGIFFVSSIFLESLKKAFCVTLVIPVSFIGLFLIFGWGGFSFDQGGYAAFLMIGGLSVNALLYILSDYSQFLKKHEPYEAMTLAISQKAWPILLTVISTCSGLIPFLIHGDGEVFWFSFAIGTIGGLLFSLIVVFWLMPVLILPKLAIKTSTSSSKH